MPYAAEHGPPLFDAIHAWAPSEADAPPPIGDSHSEPREYPQIVLDRVTGWYDSPELVDSREGRTYGAGELAYPPRTLGITTIYEATLQAQDRLDLMETITRLRAGFLVGDDGAMTIIPWAAHGGLMWAFPARVMSLVFEPAWKILDDGATYEWGFALTLRRPHATFTSFA